MAKIGNTYYKIKLYKGKYCASFNLFQCIFVAHTLPLIITFTLTLTLNLPLPLFLPLPLQYYYSLPCLSTTTER